MVRLLSPMTMTEGWMNMLSGHMVAQSLGFDKLVELAGQIITALVKLNSRDNTHKNLKTEIFT